MCIGRDCAITTSHNTAAKQSSEQQRAATVEMETLLPFKRSVSATALVLAQVRTYTKDYKCCEPKGMQVETC